MNKDREPISFNRRMLGRLATGAAAAATFGQRVSEQAKNLVPAVAQKLSPVGQWLEKYNLKKGDIDGICRALENSKAAKEFREALMTRTPEEIARHQQEFEKWRQTLF